MMYNPLAISPYALGCQVVIVRPVAVAR